jgi:hypothetical protein
MREPAICQAEWALFAVYDIKEATRARNPKAAVELLDECNFST